MTPRKYTLGKRAAAVEETKRRIIQATFELHDRQGPAATTLPQVAKEADVALGTVYRYFPTVEDLVSACGEHVAAMLQPPSAEMFASVTAIEDRLDLLTRRLFDMYARGSHQIAEARCEQKKLAALATWVEQSRQHHVFAVGEALRPAHAAPRTIREAVALTDFYVWKAFADAGVSANVAIDIVVSALQARLQSAPARKGRVR